MGDETPTFDSFPEDFNRDKCFQDLTTNQEKLILETRERFYEKTILAVENCNRSVELEFPERLWQEHRVSIAKEIMERFGEIRITNMDRTVSTTLITEIDNLPKKMRMVTIELVAPE